MARRGKTGAASGAGSTAGSTAGSGEARAGGGAAASSSAAAAGDPNVRGAARTTHGATFRTADERGAPVAQPATTSGTAGADPATPAPKTSMPPDLTGAPVPETATREMAAGGAASGATGPGTGSTPPDLHGAPVAGAAPRRSGGGAFLGTVLGGLVAAAIGFAAALFLFPTGWPGAALPPPDDAAPVGATPDSGRLDDLAARLDALGSQLDEVASQSTAETGDDLQALAQTSADAVAEVDQRLTELAARLEEVAGGATPDLSGDLGALNEQATGLSGQVTELSDRVAGLSDQVAGLSGRVDTLEARPDPSSADAEAAAAARLEAFRSELDSAIDDARSEMQAAQAETQQALETAEADARRAETRTALSQVDRALATGEPYPDALAALQAAVEVPDALAAPAAEGVPTLDALRADYPDAARAALNAAPQEVDESEGFTGRFGAFLRSQTNARSLSPQEGGGTDAILSRAEAALRNGDLAGALNELDGLPEGPRAEMDGWISRARTREDAVAAAAEVSGSVDGS